MRSRWLSVVFLCGCLTSTHVIPRAELARLAQLPPEERGREVRVVQGFVGAEAPPERAPAGGGVVIIGTPAPTYGYGYGHGYAARPTVKNMKDDAKWWLILAGATAVVLAVTEGLRFDGWAELGPQHPVHLWGPNDEWTWVPLGQLTPEMAMWARKGFVREEEGPWRRLRRAPLSRIGFSYSVLLGSGEVPSYDGYESAGFLGHIELGGFFTQSVGVLFDIGLGWRTDRDDLDDVFHSRYALELELLPLDAGAFHAGVYGEVGMAYRFEDLPDGFGDDRASFLAGGGGIVQLELTTRLALTVKGGVAAIAGDRAAELTAGISIY